MVAPLARYRTTETYYMHLLRNRQKRGAWLKMGYRDLPEVDRALAQMANGSHWEDVEYVRDRDR